MSRQKAAEMLVVGFSKHWDLRAVFMCMGVMPSDTEGIAELAKQVPFLPSRPWELRRPVRAFIENNWPKLSSYLRANEHNPEKLVQVCKQVEKLTCDKNKIQGAVASDDLKEANKMRRKAKAVNKSYEISRDAFKTHQRSAWSVCK